MVRFSQGKNRALTMTSFTQTSLDTPVGDNIRGEFSLSLLIFDNGIVPTYNLEAFTTNLLLPTRFNISIFLSFFLSFFQSCSSHHRLEPFQKHQISSVNDDNNDNDNDEEEDIAASEKNNLPKERSSSRRGVDIGGATSRVLQVVVLIFVHCCRHIFTLSTLWRKTNTSEKKIFFAF